VWGFDADVRRCEDYDAYLRLARRYPVAGHSAVVADYRIHSANMSADFVAMAEWASQVQARHRPADGDAAGLAAYRRGRRRTWQIYSLGVWRERGGLAAKWAMTRRAPLASLLGAALAGLRLALPERAYLSLRQAARRRLDPAGGVPARTEPLSRTFGYDRGTPVDRWYIERFLGRQAGDIRGRVLEIGDDAYSRRFGGDIARQDVLHVTPGAPGATIVGDISQPGTLPEGAFDCMVITQTLHLVYDLPTAVEHLRRSLAPGGVLLLTVPGVSSVDPGEWGATWYWSLTPAALERLLGEAFGSENVSVEAFGNVYAATSFLYGLAVEDLDPALLAAADRAYPMVVCARARRAA
jgi:SAM-dependent methyltransferase